MSNSIGPGESIKSAVGDYPEITSENVKESEPKSVQDFKAGKRSIQSMLDEGYTIEQVKSGDFSDK